MFSGRLFSKTAVVAAVTLFCGSCGIEDNKLGQLTSNSADRVGQEFGNLPSQIGGIFTGKTTYVLIPGFYQKLNPWIKDQSAFSALMEKYSKQKQYTDREKADLIIQIGILQNAPQWLTPQALSLIDKYYPGIRKRKAEGFVSSKIRVALNERSNYASDAVGFNFTLAQDAGIAPTALLAAPASFFAVGSYVDALAFVAGFNPVVLTVLATGLITATAVEEIIQHKQQICDALGGCKNPDEEAPLVSSGNGNCTPDQKSRYQQSVDDACGSATKCTGDDSIELLVVKIGRASSCIDARRLINNVCFSGGDVGHNQAVSERVNQINKCKGMMSAYGK